VAERGDELESARELVRALREQAAEGVGLSPQEKRDWVEVFRRGQEEAASALLRRTRAVSGARVAQLGSLLGLDPGLASGINLGSALLGRAGRGDALGSALAGGQLARLLGVASPIGAVLGFAAGLFGKGRRRQSRDARSLLNAPEQFEIQAYLYNLVSQVRRGSLPGAGGGLMPKLKGATTVVVNFSKDSVRIGAGETAQAAEALADHLAQAVRKRAVLLSPERA